MDCGKQCNNLIKHINDHVIPVLCVCNASLISSTEISFAGIMTTSYIQVHFKEV